MNTLDSGVSTGSEIEEEGGGVGWGDRSQLLRGTSAGLRLQNARCFHYG